MKYRGWWDRSAKRYPHHATAPVETAKPVQTHAAKCYGDFISVGAEEKGLRVWGFDNAKKRDLFVRDHRGAVAI